MTEEEAKAKWCPMARIVTVDSDNLVLNRAAFNKCNRQREKKSFTPSGTNCIASDCMMWVKEYKYDYYMGVRGPAKEVGGHCGLVK